MIIDWIVLFFLIIYPVYIGLDCTTLKKKEITERSLYFMKDILQIGIVLAILLILKPSLYSNFPYSSVEGSMFVSEELIIGLSAMFFVQFVLSFTPWNLYPREDLTRKDEIFGLPSKFVPDSFKELPLFGIFIFCGVVFEELIARYFLLQSLHYNLGLNGDVLILTSSVLFAFGHLYQGLKGVISNFFVGYLLANLLLISET